jgi:hypothetical protein
MSVSPLKSVAGVVGVPGVVDHRRLAELGLEDGGRVGPQPQARDRAHQELRGDLCSLVRAGGHEAAVPLQKPVDVGRVSGSSGPSVDLLYLHYSRESSPCNDLDQVCRVPNIEPPSV